MLRVAAERSKLTTNPDFFVRIFFEDATSDVDLFLNESISTHSRFHSREYLFCFCKISGRELDLG